MNRRSPTYQPSSIPSAGTFPARATQIRCNARALVCACVRSGHTAGPNHVIRISTRDHKQPPAFVLPPKTACTIPNTPGSKTPAAPSTPPVCTSATPKQTPPRGPPSAAWLTATPRELSDPTSATVSLHRLRPHVPSLTPSPSQPPVTPLLGWESCSVTCPVDGQDFVVRSKGAAPPKFNVTITFCHVFTHTY